MIEAASDIASFYDGLAGEYDKMTDMDARIVQERPFFRRLVERYRVRDGLDAGCGTGLHAVILALLGVRVTAIDLSPEMLARVGKNARAHGVSVNAKRLGLGEIAGLGASRFDAVVSMGNTLAHVLDEAELRTIANGLRTVVTGEGFVMLQTLNYRLIARDRETELNRRERDGVVYRRSYAPDGAFLAFRTEIRSATGTGVQEVLHRPWDPDALRRTMVDAGFNDVRLFGGVDMREFDPATSRDSVILAVPG